MVSSSLASSAIMLQAEADWACYCQHLMRYTTVFKAPGGTMLSRL